METQHYLNALKKYHQLPIGLEAYLTQILEEFQFKKKHKITANIPPQNFLSYIKCGAARLYAKDRETHEEQTLDFFFEGDFLPLIPQMALAQSMDLAITFLEYTTTLAISERHYLFLPRIFPQIIHLYQSINEKHYLNQIDRNILREILPAHTRYQQLRMLRPELSNRVSITDMASFLGIHPNTLSALRGKK